MIHFLAFLSKPIIFLILLLSVFIRTTFHVFTSHIETQQILKLNGVMNVQLLENDRPCSLDRPSYICI